MYTKLFTAVLLLAVSGIALAGGKTCTITIYLYENATTWTFSMAVAAACLVAVLGVRLFRNRSHA